MTALDGLAPHDWADIDTRHLTSTIARAHRDDTLDMLARRGLALAAQYPDRAGEIVRAVDAALTVRTAELAALAEAQADGCKQWILDRLHASFTQGPQRTAGQVAP